MRHLVAAIVTAFALLTPSSGSAQAAYQSKPVLILYADTAGVSAIAHDVYQTWVWAQADGKPPAAGALVGFDCQKQLVKRFGRAQFKPWTQDSTLIQATIDVTDSTGWVPVHYPKMLEEVCSSGRAHGIDPYRPEPIYPDSLKQPAPAPKRQVGGIVES